MSFTNMTLSKPDFPSSAAFDELNKAITVSEATRKNFLRTKLLVQFDIKNKEGKISSWYLDVKDKGEAGVGKVAKPDITLIVADSDFTNLIKGSANAQKLFMSGKLKVKGNVMKATALEKVLKAARPPTAKL